MHLTDIARDPGHTLTLEQKRALDEARALVDRTQLQCLQLHLFICVMLWQCKAR